MLRSIFDKEKIFLKTNLKIVEIIKKKSFIEIERVQMWCGIVLKKKLNIPK